MAVASYAVEILGAVLCKKGVTIKYADIHTQYPTATLTIMKTEGVNVSINGTDMFPATYDAQNYLPSTTTSTAVFDKDCVLVIGRYEAVT